ncbi:hypothetical protein [Dyadobacter psychrotolerans]|uniref:WG repeat-containing protein n=1 Tax=Dyadobacter psychrotolerans TaxID=2541721 RepID=A0A4R5DBQ8_9BACT|nr:hypothetical protein [Dyadobacter psychrotolerans]TDE09420.1 hypothetical protein E0F88_30850 [Dyadobacter psychrotolerans]
MKSICFTVLMAILPSLLIGQRILRYSNESKRATGDTLIEKITPQRYGRYVRIRYYDGSKQKLFKDSLWGYIDKKGTVYRIYRREHYKVLETDEIGKYAYKKYVGKAWRTYPAYSKNLDSRIVNRKKKLQKLD